MRACRAPPRVWGWKRGFRYVIVYEKLISSKRESKEGTAIQGGKASSSVGKIDTYLLKTPLRRLYRRRQLLTRHIRLKEYFHRPLRTAPRVTRCCWGVHIADSRPYLLLSVLAHLYRARHSLPQVFDPGLWHI